MSTTKVLKRIDELFDEKLQTKTGWGKNEVLQAYRDIVSKTLNEVLAEMLDEHEKKQDKTGN